MKGEVVLKSSYYAMGFIYDLSDPLYESKFRTSSKRNSGRKPFRHPLCRTFQIPWTSVLGYTLEFQRRSGHEPGDWKTVFEYDSILLSRQRASILPTFKRCVVQLGLLRFIAEVGDATTRRRLCDGVDPRAWGARVPLEQEMMESTVKLQVVLRAGRKQRCMSQHSQNKNPERPLHCPTRDGTVSDLDGWI